MNTQHIAEWISRPDAAALAGCSEDTIKRDVKARALTTRTGARGVIEVRVEDLVAAGRISPAAIGPNGAVDSAEVLRLRDTVEKLRTQIARLEGQLSQSDQSLEILATQLKRKDETQKATQASLDQTQAILAGVLDKTLGGAR